MVKSFRGRSFKVRKGTTHPEYSINTFEEEGAFKDEHWMPKLGDVVVDVGASYGSYALTACSQGARVFAFEPEPTVFKDLRTNVEVNGWEDVCRIFNHGLWDKPEKVNMRSYAPHWPSGTISGDYSMETLDGVVDALGIPTIDWIKIDVEGAEARVVRGGLRSISSFKPKLIVECHIFLDAGLVDEVEGLISSAGSYDFEHVDRPPCVMVIATPKSSVIP